VKTEELKSSVCTNPRAGNISIVGWNVGEG